MELTIIERDPLNIGNYNSYTPAVIVSKNKESVNSIIIAAAIIIGLLVLFLILERYAENNIG